MTVGNQASTGSIDASLSSNALQLREACRTAANFQEFVVSLGLSGLEALGYSPADAQSVLTFASYMNNVAGCYFGTVQQGGSGGTGAILFNFDNALCQLWAGQ